MEENTVCQNQTLWNSPVTELSLALLSISSSSSSVMYLYLKCLCLEQKHCAQYVLLRAEVIESAACSLFHMESGALRREEGKEHDFSTVYTPLAQQTHKVLPASLESLCPRMSPSQKLPAMQRRVYQTGTVEPKASRKPQTGLDWIRNFPEVRKKQIW